VNLKLRATLGALISLALLWGCQPRTVVRNGVEMPYDQAAGLDFRLAQERYAKGRKSRSRYAAERIR